MVKVYLGLAIAALVCTIIGGTKPTVVPLWVGVLLLCILEMIQWLLVIGGGH